MSDLHVEALVYRVECDVNFDYDSTAPLEFETDEFRVRIADKIARFELKTDCATEDKAKAIVDPFTMAWAIKAEFRHGPGVFRLAYGWPEIVDRSRPGSGPIPQYRGVESLVGSVTVHIPWPSYPDPPVDFAISNELNVAYAAWRAVWPNQQFQPALGYLILTMLEGPAASAARITSRRRSAATRYAIDLHVLQELGRLTSEKGGEYARKAEGLGYPLSPQEDGWIGAAMRVLLRRMGEHNRNPTAGLPQITMADLPPLP